MDNILKLMDEYIKHEKIEELESIKAEINFIAEKCLPSNIAEEYEIRGLKTAIEIIDKHIEKLKED